MVKQQGQNNSELILLIILAFGFFCMIIDFVGGEREHKSFRQIAHEIWLDQDDPRMSNNYNSGTGGRNE